MKYIKFTILLFTIWFTGSLLAGILTGNELSTDEMRKLLIGNSVEGESKKWGWEGKIYFDPNGTFRKIDQNENKNDGTWEFEREGVFCIDAGKVRCWRLTPGDGEDTYNVHSRTSGMIKKTWKVRKGNPFNL